MSGARIAIVGSREFPDARSFVSAWIDPIFEEYAPDYMREVMPTIVSGGARGVDSVAVEYAKRLGFPTEVIPAAWDRWGRRAGYIRNLDLVDSVDSVVAFWDGESKGTKNTIDQALRQRKHLEVIFPPASSPGGTKE